MAATGIDRVELAYAEYLIAHESDRTWFCAYHPMGFIGLLHTDQAKWFVEALSRRWGGQTREDTQNRARLLQLSLLRWKRGSLPWGGITREKAIYLLVSHHHLTRPGVIGAVLKRWRADLIVMLHDLIPIEFPEYSRPREAARHVLRVQTIADFAHGVIVPADAVGRSLGNMLRGGAKADCQIWTIPHGVPDAVKTVTYQETTHTGREGDTPYFVCLGTIEPRKNHLLLLNLWRDMVKSEGGCVPRLLLIGKRGWENENVLDMLERCAALRGHVEELSGLSDEAVVSILRGARGLLFPTFAEGFGLPLAEALTLGVPSIVADIEVLREVGREIPCYLDPNDGIGWRAAIADFAAEGPVYRAQKALVANADYWGWTESVAASITKIDQVAVGAVNLHQG
ncbi:glycosyltransferase family 1 protein [Asaia sp. As-1742]|uniref:glycosyltransferase family 4 protein n=1 Tax=Asaia sp. As-1742 TaxID=2608325 RepID=UPI001422FEC4|nr:glycosyltransferase family 1 protein [Asaia sp. As-1742]NIE80777.1 glycosyltransferase family 4 protein [Asaia sp. As-1742]